MLAFMASTDDTFDLKVTPEWIADQLDRLEKSNADLARGTGISYRAITGILSAQQQRRIKHSEAIAIQRWFAEQAGEIMPAAQGEGGVLDALARPHRGGGDVPLFGTDATGVVRLTPAARMGTTPCHPAQLRTARAFALVIYDDLYAPRFRSGETAYAIASLQPQRGQDCIVELKDGEAIVGEFEGRDAAVRIRRGHEVKAFPAGNVRALHAVVGRG